MFQYWSHAKSRIDDLNDTNPEVLKNLQAENPDKWSVSSYEALRDAVITFVRNGLPKANGPDGTFTYTKDTLANSGGPTVNREQALRSAVPKPDGTFGKFSVLV